MLETLLPLGKGFISTLLCMYSYRARNLWYLGPCRVGKSQPSLHPLQRPWPGPFPSYGELHCILQSGHWPCPVTSQAVANSLRRGRVGVTCCPHPDSNKEKLATYHTSHTYEEKGAVSSLSPVP